jgi:hypothetical protein
LKHAFAMALTFALVACGGGGGSPGSAGGSGGTGSTGTTTTTTTVTASPTLTLAIYNASNVKVSSIALGGGFVARATVLDATSTPVANKLVTFSQNGSIATLSPLTALTNASGIAEVAIAPATVSAVGASTLSADATVSGSAVHADVDFSVSATSLALSAITVGSGSLASGGNTSLQVTALVGGAPSTGVPVNVAFSASCGKVNGIAGAVSVTTNGSGIAAANYDAVQADGSLCSGPVTISAASPGAVPKTVSISVAAPSANAVVFVSALPAQIFVSGSGAIEQSLAKFKVLSSAGTPLPGVGLKFSIITNPGGVGLNATGSAAAVTATTNASGEGSVSVFSGTIPGPVKVRAELVSNAAVFAESQNLTVASGPPSQRFMSLSVSTYNIEGEAIDGSTTVLTARLADRQGNAVDDGTVVNFTAEGGQVAVSCATQRVNGISLCSVNFQSQNPRPSDGRVSVLAFTEGTKDYVDVNGNNHYDAGVDTLLLIGDAYRDDNENGVYDAAGTGEFVVGRGGVVACASVGEPFPSRANTCDTSLATTVRQQAVILYSSSTPLIDVTTFNSSVLQFNLRSADHPLLPMPAGTTVAVDASGGTCALDKVFGTTVPNVSPTTNPLADLATSHLATFKTCASGDFVQVTIKTPSGLSTQQLFFIP